VPLVFFDDFVEDLPVEIGDSAIGADAAGADVADVYACILLVVRDFDIGVLAAFLVEDFDADVIVLGGRTAGVFAVDLAVEVDGGSAGGFGFAGHFEVGRIDGLPLVAGSCGEKGAGEQNSGNENEDKGEAARIHARLLMDEMGGGQDRATNRDPERGNFRPGRTRPTRYRLADPNANCR